MKFRRISVDRLAILRGADFSAAVWQAAICEGQWCEVENELWLSLLTRFPKQSRGPGLGDSGAAIVLPIARYAAAPTPAPESTSLVTKLTRARHELGRWLKAGAPLAPRATRRQRLAICRSCPYYRPDGNWGLGECQAPGCGCTRTKLALATSTCPLTPPKWTPCKVPAAPLQPVR